MSTIPFVIHALVETPAALSFILYPSLHLQPLTPAATLLLQSLGGLLLTSNLIALIFARRPFDDVSRQVAIAFAFWHVWPCYRAYTRLSGRGLEGDTPETRSTLGGPVVHLGVHSILLTMFLYTWYLG
ncbi:hypothetical protein NW755_005329 [Fusarium falciforme]|uniref:Uncharacterized protein n=1 Tax=Fusarium falciforme TaxID=195108 RepID=A0A9W8RAN0_9HYPO|nr:hypothetical protein NW755_005329 [Fusarium falciforme]